MSYSLTPEVIAQYQALTCGLGMADVSDRTRIDVTGRDRQSFLHNMCTNDVKRLTPGKGCEAFFTNPQGKVLGYANVFCHDDSLLIESVAGQTKPLMTHLDRYIIREDVQLNDRAAEWRELLLASASAADAVATLLGTEPPTESMSHVAGRVAAAAVTVYCSGLAGPRSYLIRCAAADQSEVSQALAGAGAVDCSAEAVEIARVEAGSPYYGRDITEKNLPQEVNRTERAISFTKGCYIGQETVARIDALGHVNRLLVGVSFESDEVPAVGAELLAGGKAIGQVTSAVFSPRLKAPFALAYVRREHAQPATKLESPIGAAEVVLLPLLGP